MVRIWMAAVAVLAMASAGTVRGDEIEELKRQLQEQYNQLMLVQNRLMELEAAQKRQAEQIRALPAAPAREFELPATLVWLEKVRFYGDFRYRFENVESDLNETRNRNRVRARFGVQTRINEEVTFDLRLASGGWFDDDAGEFVLGGNPTSANETLDTYFSSKSFWLDRAYLTYQPAWGDGLKVLAGKMGNPFYNVAQNQLIWDSDVNPEGAAVQYGMDWSQSDRAFVNAGVFFVEENASVTLWGIQAGLRHQFSKDGSVLFGASYYDYMNIKGATPDIAPTGGTYAFDYNMVELFGEVSTRVGGLPFAVFGNWVNNVASGVGRDTAWLAGVGVNKLQKPGDWAFSYDYRDIQADAVLGVFNDGDFNGGGTGARGHRLGFNYMLLENTVLGTNYYCTEGHETNADEKRLQLEVLVKF